MGAACTRHSLRPLLSEGVFDRADLGFITPREDIAMSEDRIGRSQFRDRADP